jgi:outer membrane usher protein
MKTRALFAALIFALAPALARADADVLEPEVAPVMQAPFRLVLNHSDRGEIIVVLKGGDVFVKREDLLAAGLAPLGGSDEQLLGERLLSLRSVSPPLHYEIDERTIELRIEAPTDLLPTTRLDLGGSPPQVEYRRDTAAFFNYAPRINDLGQATLYEETGVSIGGDLLFSSLYLSSENQPRRGLTNFTIDDREKLRRIVIGDALVTTGPLGSGRFIGGVTLSRTYELNPYAIKTPNLGYVGTAITPATIDVYVNGSRVYTEQVQPGTFRLDNLRVGGGKGLATYVIRDVFGHEQTITDPFYISSGVLAKGLSEYTYSLGALRDDIGTESWGYHHPAAAARHRIGLSNYVTLGGRAEASHDRISAGPAVDVLTPIGSFGFELGASGALYHRPGAAASLSYSFTSRFLGAGLFARLMSNQYATLSIGPTIDRPVTEAGAFQSVPLGERFSVSLQQLLSRYRDRGTAARVGAQLSFHVTTLCTAMLSASQTWIEDGSHPWDVFANINYSFEGGPNASVGGRLSNGDPSLLVSASKSLSVGPSYGYRASALISEHSSADGLVQYQTLFGRYGLEFSADQVQRRVTFDAAGSLVLVPGAGLFPSLPVQDGFGVIRVAGVSNVRGYVNNQELGRTDRNGNLLVPNLLSYYGNRLSIAAEDVPIEYAVPKTEMTLAPSYRGPAIADFHVTVVHYFRGQVVILDHDARVVPKYGELHVQTGHGEEISPLGDQAEFELEGLERGPHQAFVDYAAGRCAFEIQVQDSEQLLIELGELVCHTSP